MEVILEILSYQSIYHMVSVYIFINVQAKRSLGHLFYFLSYALVLYLVVAQCFHLNNLFEKLYVYLYLPVLQMVK
jgi:predicted CDP-diglyceride synthetase/phosphatidate cytidylyltransferase